MLRDKSIKQKLLILTMGVNLVSFFFCTYLLTQAKGSLNSMIFWGALIGIVLWGCMSFLFVTSMSTFFSSLVIDLISGAKDMRHTVAAISDISNRLAEATTEQASALQETAASVEEMSAMIKKNAESAQRSKDVATQSSQVANKGKNVVDKMVAAIEDINISNTQIMKAIEESHQEFTEIVRVITEIGGKTKVINDIVFQTKLLSFNASVEAARAGVHGKGFAVVAEEVGNLAQMSGNAAKEITDMLDSSVQKVDGIVNATRDKVGKLIAQGRYKVEVGTGVANSCGEVLEDVVRNVTRLHLMVDEISTATSEQSQGISEINRAIGQLDQVTHANAITSQQAASAAVQLSAQTESFSKVVQNLKFIIEGSAAGQSVADYSPKKNFAQVTPIGSKKAPVKDLQNFALEKIDTGPLQKVPGADNVPSYDDPRFKDV